MIMRMMTFWTIRVVFPVLMLRQDEVAADGGEIELEVEQEVKDANPDYMIVLPWHFKNGIIQREKEYMRNGGKFIFPLPYIQII